MVLLALIATAAVIVAGFRWGNAPSTPERATEHNPFDLLPRGKPATAADGYDPAAVVGEFCTTCHVLPPPDCEPKDLWPGKIEEMYGYAQNERPVGEKNIPPIHVPTKYFTSRAPEYLPAPEDAMGSPPSPLAFEQKMISLDAIPSPPAVSHVKFVRLSDDAPTQLLVSDMRHGVVVLWTPSHPDEPATVIARIPNPSHTHVVDLDRDGLRDVLVANLGVFWNVDTTEASVVWLRGRGNNRFDPVVLIDRISRVNDVQTADFDEDGDLDLVVAVFGNLTTGRIAYMENRTEDYAKPDFEAISLDEHTGTTDVPVVDLNDDGLADFVALQAQESERVVAFLNNGGGNFKPETVYAAPHPHWGSTGIRLIDLDGDDDVDVLFNHGDAVQTPPIPRPYHGFGWLENKGVLPLTYHRLAHLPGAHTSLPADLDGDGDLDLVSSVFIPPFAPDAPSAEMLETVIWLEQTLPGQYRRYVLETGAPFHPCADLGDYDDDGDVDVVLGNFILFPAANDAWKSCITVLENPLTPPAPTPR